jgi:3-deoxy-D-manno-octulosonic acid (KDO) 8-phosphate synthase
MTRAAIAVGVDGCSFKYPDPSQAKSDSATRLPLADLSSI